MAVTDTSRRVAGEAFVYCTCYESGAAFAGREKKGTCVQNPLKRSVISHTIQPNAHVRPTPIPACSCVPRPGKQHPLRASAKLKLLILDSLHRQPVSSPSALPKTRSHSSSESSLTLAPAANRCAVVAFV